MRDTWIGWRNRLLASPRFHRLAARLPFTRRPARRHARALFDLVAGFTYSQTLAACVELDLFALLGHAPLPLDAIAAHAGLELPAAERLVKAAAAIGLFERLAGDRVTLGVAGAALRGNPGAVAMVAHHRLLYADLADPVALLRRGGGGGVLQDFWRYAANAPPDAVSGYSALMAASLAPVAEQLLDAYPIARHRRLLDVGGGEGAFLAAAAARAPALELGLFDLAAVGARAQARLGGRITVHPGDFRHDPLPTGYDAISLVRVLHDHDRPVALALLRAARIALPSGGRLLICEPMAAAAGAGPVGDTYFGFYLLAMGSGGARTPKEIAAMLREAGFASSRRVRTTMPLIASMIVAPV